MKFFLTIFIPPLYLFTRGKTLAGIINGVFYLIAFPTLMLGGLGLLFWVCCVGHAGFYLQKEMANEQAERTATRAAEKVTAAMAAQQADPTKNY